MSDATAVLERPRKARQEVGRTSTGERGNVVEVTLDDDELAVLDALLAKRGKKRGRATLLRRLMLDDAEKTGITLPGQAAERGVTAA